MVNNWNIDLIPDNSIGFVYMIVNNIDSKFYIGKKNFYKVRKKVKSESDWRTYKSSSVELKRDIKVLGISNFSFTILKICYSKRDLTYYETKFQFIYDVLEKNSYNKSILGKFFRKK